MIFLHCIYDQDPNKIKKYVKDNNIEDCINYLDIFTKLTKNDMYNKEPSDRVLNMHIFKMLEKCIEETKSTTINYVVRDLDEIIFSNLKKVISELANDKVNIKLCVFTHPKKRFKSVDSISVLNETEDIQ